MDTGTLNNVNGGIDTQGTKSQCGKSRAPGKKKAGLVTFGCFLVILLFVIEGTARIVTSRSKDPSLRVLLHNYSLIARGDETHFRFVADDVLPYRLAPGFEVKSSDGLSVTRHNRAGFRDDSEYGSKSPDILRIVCIGGSIVYGAGVDDNAATYPASLARWLNNTVKPKGWKSVEVFNLGVGGYTSAEDLVNLRVFGLPLKPDAVLIHTGVNDVAPRFYPDFRCDYGHFRKKMRPLRVGPVARLLYRSHLALVLGWKLGLVELPTLMSRTQQPLPSVDEALANLAHNDTGCFQDNVKTMIDLCRESGVRVWLLTTPYLNAPDFESPTEDMRLLDNEGYQKGIREHNVLIRELAKSAETGLVDLDRDMPPNRLLFTDPIHYSEQGNAVAAKLIAETIAGGLRK